MPMLALRERARILCWRALRVCCNTAFVTDASFCRVLLGSPCGDRTAVWRVVSGLASYSVSLAASPLSPF